MENDNKTIINVAMEIILHAGDARNESQNSLAKAKLGNFEEAEQLLANAKKDITLAHNAQTTVIQNTVNEKDVKVPLLFIHAQDTLMTIMSEINMTKELVAMYKFIMDSKGGNK